MPQRIHGSESKIELWYQILAFYQIAGMIYLGALAPLIFENSIPASLDQGGRQDISASARFITRVIPTPRFQTATAQRLLSNPHPPSNSSKASFQYLQDTCNNLSRQQMFTR